MDRALLDIKNLSAWYSDRKKVLSDFSLALAEQEVAGLIGLNGAGKTTFLKVLSGLLPTFRADGLRFCGAPVDFRKQDFKRCRYTVFAEDSSFSYFTFREYLSYVCGAYGREVPDVAELVRGFRFEEYEDVLLKELSTGNRKKAYLIAAFALKPRLLLLDEHTAALDPKTAAKVLEISDRIIAENHLTAMMVTHNMKDAIAHGNRLIMMHEGKVILDIRGEKKKKLTVEDLLHQFEKVSGGLLGSQVEDALFSYILNEPVEIGEKIPNEFELAERFGVGRGTIREAVKGLVSRGVLEVRRGSGTYVVSTSTLEEDPLGLSKFQDKYKLALELFDVRLMLEPEIAVLACEYAKAQELAQLKNLCDEVEQLYLAGKNHIKKDVEFHTCIARCSKNRVVEILIPVINTAVTTFANLTHRILMKETIETHRAITQAILERDAVGAKCAMVMHLTYNRQMIMKLLKEQEAQGR